jgi:hypothetical protein
VLGKAQRLIKDASGERARAEEVAHATRHANGLLGRMRERERSAWELDLGHWLVSMQHRQEGWGGTEGDMMHACHARHGRTLSLPSTRGHDHFQMGNAARPRSR